MRVLITGANGFLGHYLIEKLLQKQINVIATGKGICRLPFATNSLFVYEQMDFTNPLSVQYVISKHEPTVIVHAGASSKPDECEANQQKAFEVNTQGTENLLTSAKDNNAFFIFISTDFVFDGEKGMYVEDDIPNPVNYYGTTKLLAEKNVIKYEGAWSIVRTVLVYGKPNSGRNNLLTIVKEKIESGEGYSVFNDQQRTPTYVGDLADGIIAIIEKNANGIFHISGMDILSPYEMACKTADLLGLNKKLIKEITEQDMQQFARRPSKTGLNISKAIELLDYCPISFDEGIKKTFLY